MNANLQPLAMLLEQSERERDTAIAQHQRAHLAAQAATAQVQQLLEYRREHEQRWRTQFAREGQMEVVKHYHSFTERLTQAIDQQNRVAEHAQQQLENATTALRVAETRCASVRKLIERKTNELRVINDRREQKQTDEAATRAWSRLDSDGRRA